MQMTHKTNDMALITGPVSQRTHSTVREHIL